MTAQLKDFGIGVDDYGVDKPLDHDSAAATVTTSARSSTGDAERPRLAGPGPLRPDLPHRLHRARPVGTSLLTIFRPAPDSAVGSVSAASEPGEQEPAPAAALLPPVDPTPAGSDVTAVTWQGYSMPVSASAGPQRMTDTRATGFARTPLGAALAALHISVRMAPMTGPTSTGPPSSNRSSVTTPASSSPLSTPSISNWPRSLASAAGAGHRRDTTVHRLPRARLQRQRRTVDLVVTNPYKNTDLQYAIPVRWSTGTGASWCSPSRHRRRLVHRHQTQPGHQLPTLHERPRQ